MLLERAELIAKPIQKMFAKSLEPGLLPEDRKKKLASQQYLISGRQAQIRKLPTVEPNKHSL